MCVFSENTIPDPQRVIPFFQPIVSLQTQRIIAYESLGREIVDGRVRSLGLFFGDTNITADIHIKVDRHLRELAFAKLIQAECDFQLFINLKPLWIYSMYNNTDDLPTSQLIDRYKIPPSRIVIEVIEENFTGIFRSYEKCLRSIGEKAVSLQLMMQVVGLVTWIGLQSFNLKY